MPPKIHLGVNLNFAKFVFGFRRSLEIVRDIGLRHAEINPDIDFGPTFYQMDAEKFRAYHRENAEIAQELGVSIDTLFFFHRDNAAIAHPNAEVREAAYVTGLSALETAACYGIRLAGSQLMAIHREDAEDPERFAEMSDHAHKIWMRWMEDAHRLGLSALTVEMMSTIREGCSTIPQTEETVAKFDAFHAAHSDTTVPTEVCYDIGHGISKEESSDPKDRDFRAWLEAFAGRIPEIHLKDTDEEFMSTWHFGTGEGIVELPKVIAAVRDVLTVPEVWLHLEVPGKRGRLLAENRNVEGFKQSVDILKKTLRDAGYREDEGQGTWYPE